MNDDILLRARRLSDKDLLAHVKLLARREREATAALVAHLAVLDERRLFLGEGFASLFTYCVQALHLSEHAAYNRIEVARAIRRFPLILHLLAEGCVTLTTVRLLAPHLTAANHEDLLRAARRKGKREVEEIIAQLHPRPSVVSSVRMLPMTRSGLERVASPATGATAVGAASPAAVNGTSATVPLSTIDTPATEERPGGAEPSGGETWPAREASPARVMTVGGETTAGRGTPSSPACIEPLGARRYRVQFTATADVRDKLTLAQDLLRHQIPDGDIGEIFDRALTLLLGHLARQKFSATDRPRSQPADQPATASSTRHIPAEVKRAVWLRDGGRCAFVGRNERRCEERGFLEFHHVVPFSAGGTANVDNLELRCRAHNTYEATLFVEGLTPYDRIDLRAAQRRAPGPLRSSERDGGRPTTSPVPSHLASADHERGPCDSRAEGRGVGIVTDPVALPQMRAGP